MKKILFCTVDSWNQNISASSTNTYATLFAGYPSEMMAGLYLREEYPENDMCCMYYQISERKIIRSLFHRFLKTGKILFPDAKPSQADLRDLETTNKLYSNNRKQRKYYKLFVRELIWKFGHWKTKELNDFLDIFCPDIVIFSMEGYIHFNRICRYIVKRTGARSIGYVWDDTFTYKQVPGNLGFKILRYFQRKSLKKTARICNDFWAITPKTKEEFDAFAHVDCKIVTKPLNEYHVDEIIPFKHEGPIKILYTGNLAIGRIDTLRCLSDALEIINANATKITVDVYTNTVLTEDDKKQFSKAVFFHKPVPSTQVVHLQKEADVLLFMEDIVGNNSKKARLSFSTKITDYFSAAKCILAIGPADIAPMDYLKKEDAAICINDKKLVANALNMLISNPFMINEYAQKALNCGLKNHSKEKIINVVKSSIDVSFF